MEKAYFVGRHFEDKEDLSKGLDTELKPLDEQSPEIVQEIASKIIENTREKGFSKVVIVTSSRKRAYSTAEVIRDAISKTDGLLQVGIIADPHFDELHHGEPIIPQDHAPQKRIQYLDAAWKAFWHETFTENGDYRNPDYRFGDSETHDGEVAYPELVGHFSKTGESYKDLSRRYYEGVLGFLERAEHDDSKKVNLALIAHSATTAILSNMYSVLSRGDVFRESYRTGDFMKLCWNEHQEEVAEGRAIPNIPGAYTTINLESVDFPKAIEFLRKEIAFLKVEQI
jgi:broad specificity phosphatase PhoE